ncbi:hypothetical protein C5Y96_24185 [Blastopirellula marina]|uniref:Uncharacterized protein n=1 Tax=Blastopirellula marina TaxID=124 RepID=A0A2S8F0K3_9BACT|nr:hypothetical protein C5Y96_24185 [Blastopirellula marina]RCS42408.1 hypothetical protein DTL36_24235 [Bremerella cremea]
MLIPPAIRNRVLLGEPVVDTVRSPDRKPIFGYETFGDGAMGSCMTNSAILAKSYLSCLFCRTAHAHTASRKKVCQTPSAIEKERREERTNGKNASRIGYKITLPSLH